MSATLLLQNILNGFAIGCVYAIFALGYTLIFSILRIINFSHGAVFAVGAYVTYYLTGKSFGFNGLFANQSLPEGAGLPFPIAMVGGAIVAGLLAVVLERLAFRPLRAKGADPLLSLVSGLGLAVILVNLIQLMVGAEPYAYPSNPFGDLPTVVNFAPAFGLEGRILIQTPRIIVVFVSIGLMLALTFVITRTKFGKALLAISEDPVTANLLGINADRLIVITFFISGALGAVAGSLIGVMFGVSSPYFGIDYGLKGLAVIVLGGLGNIPGAIVGGIVIGLAENVIGGLQIGGIKEMKEAIPFIVLFIMLLARPQGLLGRSVVQKV